MWRWWWIWVAVVGLAGTASAQQDLITRNPAGHPAFIRQDNLWTTNDLLCVTAPNVIGVGGSCNSLGGGGSFDATAIDNLVWSNGAQTDITHTYSVLGRNPALTFSDNLTALSTPIKVLSDNATFTADIPSPIGYSSTYTMNYSGGQYVGFHPAGTIVWNDTPNASTPYITFHNEDTIKNETGDGLNPTTGLGLTFNYRDRRQILADGAAVAAIGDEGFTYGPRYQTTGGGTLDELSILGFSCVGVLGSGVTMHSRICYRAADWQPPINGTIEDNIGINIEPLTATHVSIGLRNSDTTVWNVDDVDDDATNGWAAQTVSAGTAIEVDGTAIGLIASGDVTMSATPTIADPYSGTSAGRSTMDGQWVILMNLDSTDSITLQSESALTGSNLQLNTPRLTLGPGDAVTLIYSATLGLWVQADGAGHTLVNSAASGSYATATYAATDTHASGTVSTAGLRATAVNLGGGSPTAADGTLIALDGVATSNTTTNGTSAIVGVSGSVNKGASGTVALAAGGNFQFTNTASGAITTAAGVYVNTPVLVTGTIGTAAGVYVSDSAGIYDYSYYATDTTTQTSGAQTGYYAGLTANPGGSSTASIRGGWFNASTSTGASSGSTVIGAQGEGTCAPTANNCTAAIGLSAFGNHTGGGTVTSLYALQGRLVVSGGGTATTGAGLTIDAPLVTSGTITDAYGISVASSGGVYDASILTNETTTGTSGSITGIQTTLTANPGSSTTATYRGGYFTSTTGASASSGATIFGVDAVGTCATSNTCGTVIGVSGIGNKGGAGNVTSAIGVYAAAHNNDAGGTLTNSIGLYIPVTVNSGTITNRYGIWQDGSTETNRFDGPSTFNHQITQAFDTTTGSLTATALTNTYSGSSVVTTTGASVTSNYSSTASNNNGTNYGLAVTADSTTDKGLLNQIALSVVSKKSGTGQGLANAMQLTAGNFSVANTNSNAVGGIGLQIADATTSGGGTFGTLVGLRIDNQTAGTTANWSMQIGNAQSYHVGNLMVGSTTAPTAKLHVQVSSTGTEVFRTESLATNDDPSEKWWHSRFTAAASSTTNQDLDLTASSRCPSSSVCMVEAFTRCHCTSGSSCTAQDGGGNYSAMMVKNVSGTISLVGSVTTPMASQISGSSLTSLTLSVSSPNARMAVVVPANFAHTCHITWITRAVGT